MKKILFFIFYSCCSLCIFAEIFQGTIINKNGKPIPNAKITLQHASDSSVIDKTFSDAKGNFLLKTGGISKDFQLQISHKDYQTETIQANSGFKGTIFMSYKNNN